MAETRECYGGPWDREKRTLHEGRGWVLLGEGYYERDTLTVPNERDEMVEVKIWRWTPDPNAAAVGEIRASHG